MFYNRCDKYIQQVIDSGKADKYRHAGIYCIKIEDQILYIGQSQNMLKRIAEHMADIEKYVGKEYEFDNKELKYKLLAEARKNEHTINFDVIYTASSTDKDMLKKELSFMESEYINKHKPLLNIQIPNGNGGYTNHPINV